MMAKTPPRLFGTCDRLLRMLQRDTAEAPVLAAALQARRAAIFEERELMQDSLERPNPPLVGWIKP